MKESEFFSTNGETYRGIPDEISEKIRQRYHTRGGAIAAIRWHKPKRSRTFCEWRVENYWNDGGRLRHKILGPLDEILKEVGIKLR